tara:strand:+ start:267 stop:758 length:492 start_codon:yes stop_codon:yes gene_type:complete
MITDLHIKTMETFSTFVATSTTQLRKEHFNSGFIFKSSASKDRGTALMYFMLGALLYCSDRENLLKREDTVIKAGTLEMYVSLLKKITISSILDGTFEVKHSLEEGEEVVVSWFNPNIEKDDVVHTCVGAGYAESKHLFEVAMGDSASMVRCSRKLKELIESW